MSKPAFITIENLSKSFRDHLVIERLNLTISEGEIVIFQGPSGVGKSTFLRCLAYLEPFQSGVIRVGSLEIKPGMEDRHHHEVLTSLHQQIGFVFQFFNLFPHLTVLENVMIAPVKVLQRAELDARDEAYRLLKRVGMEQKSDAYPASLSGGQQQRVGIARALAMNPKAILFDEPTSALDPAMKGEIADVMADFAKDGLTMLIVTHEPQIVDRIATRIIEFGPLCSITSDKRR